MPTVNVYSGPTMCFAPSWSKFDGKSRSAMTLPSGELQEIPVAPSEQYHFVLWDYTRNVAYAYWADETGRTVFFLQDDHAPECKLWGRAWENDDGESPMEWINWLNEDIALRLGNDACPRIERCRLVSYLVELDPKYIDMSVSVGDDERCEKNLDAAEEMFWDSGSQDFDIAKISVYDNDSWNGVYLGVPGS